jgi:hypothetical protein
MLVLPSLEKPLPMNVMSRGIKANLQCAEMMMIQMPPGKSMSLETFMFMKRNSMCEFML